MTIQSNLEEAIGNLVAAREEALIPTGSKLWNAIGVLLVDCHKALNLALADPGKEWVVKTSAAWGNFPQCDEPYTRFAAKIAAGELRKYAGDQHFSEEISPTLEIWKQIAALETIAKGGGE